MNDLSNWWQLHVSSAYFRLFQFRQPGFLSRAPPASAGEHQRTAGQILALRSHGRPDRDTISNPRLRLSAKPGSTGERSNDLGYIVVISGIYLELCQTSDPGSSEGQNGWPEAEADIEHNITHWPKHCLWYPVISHEGWGQKPKMYSCLRIHSPTDGR